MSSLLNAVVKLDKYPLSDISFQDTCKAELDKAGALVMPAFLTETAIESIQKDGEQNKHLAFFTESNHNIYLKPSDPEFSDSHPRNREVISTKGCITTDQVPNDSKLHVLYESEEFRKFLCAVLGEESLYEYADPLSSVNIHYAGEGQELGWHFDNSSFAITLMIRAPKAGGEFEYVKDVRNADAGEMNYEQTEKILNGNASVAKLTMDAGTLVLFRGRNSMHRVTPVKGDVTRMLVVLAYNTEPGIALSESARMTFYGRLGD